jgi:hypothetical protein
MIGHAGQPTRGVDPRVRRIGRDVRDVRGHVPCRVDSRFGPIGPGYPPYMLYTVLIILAIVALAMFIFGIGRRRV